MNTTQHIINIVTMLHGTGDLRKNKRCTIVRIDSIIPPPIVAISPNPQLMLSIFYPLSFYHFSISFSEHETFLPVAMPYV